MVVAVSLQTEFRNILERIKRYQGTHTKIAVVGQPGAGKSSIINALIGHKVARTGQGTDITRKAVRYRYEFLEIVDLPGYGTTMFPLSEWKEKFKIHQYDIIFFVFSGKLTKDDCDLFESVADYNKSGHRRPLLLIRNHCGDLASHEDREAIRRDIYAKLPEGLVGELYFVDCRYQNGIDKVRNEILNEKYKLIWKPRIIKEFNKAKNVHYDIRTSKAKNTVSTYAKLAGANGVNPFLGADIAADLAIYFKMFSAIKEDFDIDDNELKRRYCNYPGAKKLLELMTENGVIILLKNFGGKQVIKSIGKYIPFVGQAAAAVIGYTLAEDAGKSYVNDCATLAWQVMDKEIENYKLYSDLNGSSKQPICIESYKLYQLKE